MIGIDMADGPHTDVVSFHKDGNLEFSIQLNISHQMFWIKPAENMQEEVVRRECELILQRLVSEVKYEITSQVLRKMQEEWRKRGGVPIVDEGGEG